MTDHENKKVRLLRRSRGRLQPEVKPIVLEYKEKKKKGRDNGDDGHEEYSKGLEDVQRMEGDVMRVAQRATKALSKGVDTYEHERQQSAKAKKDGAIEDFVYNSAKASSAAMKEASELPVDIAESLNRTSYRKMLRRALRRTSRMMRLWRI
jgi:hypothetical protein